MLFYTQFVWSAFFRGGVAWGGQQRTDDTGPSWRECANTHLGHTMLAIAAGVLVAWLMPAMLPWLLLVLVGPIVAIPFSRLLASNPLGEKTRQRGWFLVPEETHPTWELRRALEPLASPASPFPPILERSTNIGLLQAVLDPRLNAIHVSLLRERPRMPVRTREYLAALGGRLLRGGPSALTPAEMKTLLWDAEAMLAAHQQLWSSPAEQMHAWWQAAFRIYNQTSQREALQMEGGKT
jgi:membrane glycosyltransferase